MTSMLPPERMVHVAAGEDGDDALVLGRQVLERRHREQAGVLHDHLVVLDHVEKRHHELVVRDGHDVVEVVAQVREDLVAHLEHSGAVGDRVGARQLHGTPRLERRRERGRALGLHADHANLGVVELGKGRHATGQAAAAHRHEDRVHERELLHDLHCNRPLAGGDARVVERVDEGVTLALRKLEGMVARLVVYVAVEHDLGTVVLGALDLDERRGLGHHHHGTGAGARGGKGDALCVVAGARGDDAA